MVQAGAAGLSRADAEALARSLASVRYEVMPMRGLADELRHLPSAATVTITTTPHRGLPATLELAAELRQRHGGLVVPHIPARMIASHDELERLMGRLADLGIEEVFVVGGDPPEPAGVYDSAAALLADMAEIGHTMRVGVAGYPEPHPLIPRPALHAALVAKLEFADYLVTQMCFDAGATRRWLADLRRSGIGMPARIGVPGVVDRARLMRIGMHIGIGNSLRLLADRAGPAARLIGGYRPDPYVEGLADVVADPAMGIAGWHIYSFNAIEKTERWRQREIARLAATA
jgi:methylenetetrahydrofolate reductase (NADPH)